MTGDHSAMQRFKRRVSQKQAGEDRLIDGRTQKTTERRVKHIKALQSH
jgi:hypothetical protein